jgi:hypothetical protein
MHMGYARKTKQNKTRRMVWYGMVWNEYGAAHGSSPDQHNTEYNTKYATGWMDGCDRWMDGWMRKGRQADRQVANNGNKKIKNSSPQSSEHTQITMGSRTVPSNKQQHQHQHQHQQAKATSRLGIKNNHSTGLLNKITK